MTSLFDADEFRRLRAARQPRGTPTDALTVSDLAARIEGALRAGFPASVRVIGEVSGEAALTALGYSVVEAQTAIQSIPKDAPDDVEERLRLALQQFTGK